MTSDLAPYTATNSPTTYNISWNPAATTAGFVNVAGATLPAGNITLAIPAAAPASTYYGRVTGTNAFGCTTLSAGTFTVTVNALPHVAPMSIAETSLCQNYYELTSDSTTGGNWASSNAAVATVSSIGTIHGLTAGTTTITYTTAADTHGCINYTTTNMTIMASPAVPAAISGPSSLCLNSTATFTDATTGGSWSSSSTPIATIGSSSGVAIPVSSGTTVILYTTAPNANGCTNLTGAVLYVNPIPGTPGAITGANNICSNTSETLGDTTTGGTWSSSNPAIASVNSSGILTGVSSGSTNINYTAINGTCSVTTTAAVTIYNLPVVSLSGSGSCVGSTLTISTNDSTDAIQWKLGGIGIAATTPTWNSTGSTVAGTTGTLGVTGTTLHSPTMIFVDQHDTLYVPDAYNNRVQKFAPGSTTGVTVAGQSGGTGGSDASHLSTPIGTYVDGNGNVYVVDQGNARVQKWARGAASGTTVAGTGTAGSAANQLSSPEQLFVDAAGNIYVADYGNNRVQKFPAGSTSGTSATTVAGSAAGTAGSTASLLNSPVGLYVDGSGNVYVGDEHNSRVQKWAPGASSGTTVAGTGTAGTGATQLNFPNGVTLDGSGNLYVADANNNRIQMWAPGASSGTTIAGSSAGTSGSTGTLLSFPFNMALDSNGLMYVADFNNYRVQKFTTNTALTYTDTSSGNYTATVINFEGCAATSNTYSINPTPTLTVSATSACRGATSASLPYTATASPNTYGIAWSAAAISAGFTNTTGASLPAGNISLTTPAAAATATYTGSLIVTNSYSCSAPATTFSVAVKALPVLSAISGTTVIGIGQFVSLTDTAAGGTWSGSNNSVIAISSTGTATGEAIGTVTATYSVTNSSGCSNAVSTAMKCITTDTWNGITSSDWSVGSNWSSGGIPSAYIDAVIPSGTPNAPDVLSGLYAVKSFTVNSTATVTISTGATLGINGNVTSNGTITGDGYCNLSANSTQTISGKGRYSNITLNNTNGVSINSTSDTVGITGTLSMSAGTFTTRGTLMLVSDSSGNGRIGTVSGGNISCNVVIQQYVPGGRRAYRFWAHPFTGSIPLSQMQNYIDITGAGGATNGFTTTTSNAPSAYWYNPLYGNSSSGNDPGWRAFTNTYGTPDSNMLHQYQGMRLFVRGTKGLGLNGAPYTIYPVTIRTYGSVNTGNQTVIMTKGTGANEDYNLIGNPYPSPTDIGTVINNAYTAGLITGAAFYVWDPYIGISGQYVTESIGGSYYLGANESFEVRTMANGNALSFAESNKVSSVTAILMRSEGTDKLSLSIYDTSYHLWDMLDIKFNNAATDSEDVRYDGAKPQGPASLNFYSWSADNVKLSLDARPFNAGKVIPLGITSSYAQDFIIKAESIPVPDSGQIYLHDKYLQKYTLLQQGTEYKFTITGDTASQGDGRFELSMSPTAVAVVAHNNNSINVQLFPNPATDEVKINYTATGKEHNSIHILDVSGETVLTSDLGIQSQGSVTIAVDKLAAGIYMVEFSSGKNKVVQKLVKE